MENTYRDINIATANEFAHLADRFGVNAWEAIEIANRHPRVNILKPGPGVGGHCISVDPWFLVEAAPDISPLVHTAREVNDGQPGYVVDLMKRKLGALDGKKICALTVLATSDIDGPARISTLLKSSELLLKEKAAIKQFLNLYTDGFHGTPGKSIHIITSLQNIYTDYHLRCAADCEIMHAACCTSTILRLDPHNVGKMTTATVASWNMLRAAGSARHGKRLASNSLNWGNHPYN